MASNDVWTVQRTMNWCVEYLERHNDEHPTRSAEWLMSAATGLSRVEIYAYFDRPLSEDERATLRESLRRRGQGEPLQYVTGEVGFRHIILRTAKGVLIPRPETEMLVQLVLDVLPELPKSGELPAVASEDEPAAAPIAGVGEGSDSDDAIAADAVAPDAEVDAAPLLEDTPEPAAPVPVAMHHILEVGCGTGCVALSLAKEGDAIVTATDISEAAINCAQRNCQALQLTDRVNIVHTDCAEGIDGPFDVLVSNPPYIPTAVMQTLDQEVLGYEPHLALDGGEDGLDFFNRLLDCAPRLLSSGALMACELHETCLDEAARRMRAAGFADVRIEQDLAGKPRFVLGHWR